MEPIIIAAIIGAGATLLAAFGAVLSNPMRRGGVDVTLKTLGGTDKGGRDPAEECRLGEVRTVLHRQESSARWNRRANNSLVFGQYVVGGVLATSFMQQSLAPNMVGFMGVVVLIASVIHQRFRPDLAARGAQRRAARLRRLARSVEDDVFERGTQRSDVPSVSDTRREVSRVLGEIEQDQLEDLGPADPKQETGQSIV